MYLCGIDLGTQSIKVIITGDDLRVRGESRRAVETRLPRPGWAEQDSRAWERALCEAVPEALDRAGVRAAEVAAIGVAGQLDGCVAVDRKGEAVSPCLIWMDRRAEGEMPALDRGRMLEVSGVVPDPGHMAAKIVWLRKHGGAAGARFHQPVSYMVERLTGRAVMDHSLASTTMLYDLDECQWSSEFLAAFGLDATKLPALLSAHTVAGPLSASWLGLPAGIPVAVGTGDDFATPLGAGVCAPGLLVCVLGTAEVVGALAKDAVRDRAGLVETHAYPGGAFFVENPGWLSGGAMRWLGELFALEDFDAFTELAARAEPGAGGVLCPPTLAGAMAPAWVPSARGCFYGLSPGLGRAEMARALLEGCAFAMRDVAERLTELGVSCGEILLLGGGAHSSLWAQIRADVSRRPVHVPARVDTCALGAAVLAAVAAGAQPDLGSAAALVAEGRKTFMPDNARAVIYDDAHARYRKLFESLRPMY